MVDQGLAALGLLDLLGARQQRLQIAVFLDQQGGGLDADAGRARHVVDRIAGQRLHIHHAFRIDAELLEHLVAADQLVLDRVQHVDAIADQLHQVLVAADDRGRAPGVAGSTGHGRDDVVGLIALRLDAGDVEGAGRVTGQRKLRAQILGRLGALRLVGGIDFVAERLGRMVKDHRRMGRRRVPVIGLHVPPQHVAEPRDRTHRQPVRFPR